MHPYRSKSLAQALAYAAEGLRYAVRTQRTFRIQLALAAAVGVVLLWVQAPALEAAVVVLAMIVVLAAELLNTGVEVVVDLLVDRNHHVLAKVAKDIAAAGVVVTVVGAAVIGFLVLGPRVGAAIGSLVSGAGPRGRPRRRGDSCPVATQVTWRTACPSDTPASLVRCRLWRVSQRSRCAHVVTN